MISLDVKKGDSFSFFARSAGSPGAMDEIFTSQRKSVIYNEIDVWDIESSGGNVGGD